LFHHSILLCSILHYCFVPSFTLPLVPFFAFTLFSPL
jgi:hypothetical protein